MGILANIFDGIASGIEDVSLFVNTASLNFQPTLVTPEKEPDGEGVWKHHLGDLMKEKELQDLVEGVYKAFENDEKITQMLNMIKEGNTAPVYNYIDNVITDVKNCNPSNSVRRSYEDGEDVMKLLAFVAGINITLPLEYRFVRKLDIRRCVPFIETPEAAKKWNEYIKEMPFNDSVKNLLYVDEMCISKFIYGLDTPVVPYFGKVDPEVKEEMKKEAEENAAQEAEEIKKEVDVKASDIKEKSEPEKINPVVIVSNPFQENNDEFEKAFPRLKRLDEIVRGAGYNIQYIKPDPNNPSPKYSGIIECQVSKDNFVKTLYVDPQVIYGDTYRLITQDRKDGDITMESYIPFSEAKMIIAACTKDGLSKEQRQELNSRLPRGINTVVNRVDMSELSTAGMNFGTWRSIVTKITKCLPNIPMCRMRLTNVVDKDHFDLVCDANVRSAFQTKIWACDTHAMAMANGLVIRFDPNIPYGYGVFNMNGAMISFDPYRDQHKEEAESANAPVKEEKDATETVAAKGSENVTKAK